VVLVLSAKNNTNYGGNLINQKYSPLDNILLQGERGGYEGLFTARQGVLDGIAAYPPQALNFYAASWQGVDRNRVPMVVLSSNRGAWMSKLLQNAVGAAKKGYFRQGYLSLDTFKGGLVPWYAPQRSGSRPVYVVVHWSEYDFYTEQLAPFAQHIKVVGFEFTAAHPALDIVGLGASRYAALQFLIELGYHRGWVVDDNVINVNGFPQTPAPVEDCMPVGSNIWGIGFTGATRNIDYGELAGTVNFAAANLNFGQTVPGLLQQVVLWNVDSFRAAHLNFCPLFVTSNEDIALCNFLQHSGRDERVITACHVIKFQPENDPKTNLGGSKEVPRRRNRLVGIFYNIEADIPFEPRDGGDRRPLSQYITETVLPNAQDKAQSTAPVVQSKAVEQVMARATLQGWYPGQPNPFDPYDGNATVQRLYPAKLPIAA
jgi:hypothetical protein